MSIDTENPIAGVAGEPAEPGETTLPEPTGGFMSRFHRRGQSGFLGRYALVGVWLVVAAVYAIIEPDVLLTSGTFQTIFGSQTALVFLGMAAVVTFAVGEFDLSISAILGLSATFIPVMVVQHGWNPAVASLVAVALCCGVGAVNGFIVVKLGIDAIVTTLGMGTLLLGLTSGFSGSQAVSGLSNGFSKIANTTVVFGLPISFFYGLALAILIAYLMRYTSLGRHMAFVGANREVARLAGVHVTRIRIGAYVTSGLLCGIGGVLVTATVGGFDPNSSPTYLLPALSATFLGTAAVQPGRFNPIGTMIAIYFLVTGIVGLQLLGYTGWISDVFYGAALITAVIASTLTRKRALRV
ncbi:ABC transporter permease [uncultured Jatrophihabitans sp.]|uniref:ABC transporter permease n=1 Tax=uncultured Jatrophihabitans sp. TaxID=1610747 RepID=UPI0035C9F2EA